MAKIGCKKQLRFIIAYSASFIELSHISTVFRLYRAYYRRV